MKRIISILLSLALVLALLPACSQTAVEPDTPAPEPEVLIAARELAETVLPASGREEALEVERLNADEDADRLATYIEAVCGLTGDQWEDAAVIRGMGASAFEILVLRLGDVDTAGQLEAVLTDYLTVRKGAFTGYAPDEAEMASNGKVRREGQYVGLFICPDPAGAEAMFAAACNGEALPPLPEPEPEPVEEPNDFTPAFPIKDLLFRLLIGAACPDWAGQGSNKAWTHGKFGWEEMIEGQYGITEDQFEEYAAACWGPQIYEIAGATDMEDYMEAYMEDYMGDFFRAEKVILFRTATEEGAEELAQILSGYKDRRLEKLEQKKTDTDDLTEESAQAVREAVAAEEEALQNAQAMASGHYAALIVSSYSEDAIPLFPRAVNDPDTKGFFDRYMKDVRPAVVKNPDPDYPDRVRFTPPGKVDMSIYDTSAILAAWEKGDPSGLSGDDREIYDAAGTLLAEIMRDGMSDLEKETAAYNWLVNHVDYDWSHQDVLEETDRRSFGPYGGLVEQMAVCLGYAASFQLLMDMSGVECITIVGAAEDSTEDHAWNMVRLGGEWYCVDVTWDAGGREHLGDRYTQRYLNITSGEMAQTHQWDYANTPEATAEDYGGAAAE